MRVLLTSCGLETEEIKAKYLEMLGKAPADTKALFIPTAAIDPDAIEVLPKCLNDLYKCAIPRENIRVYDLHKPLSGAELAAYDTVYICGGRTRYLLDRILEAGFDRSLREYIAGNGLVLGVSAGSVIFSGRFEDGLGLIAAQLDVHCSENDCEIPGAFDPSRTEKVKLGNLQAIIFEDGRQYIIG